MATRSNRRWFQYSEAWGFIFRRYLPRLGLLSLAWEILQLPLYTIWNEKPWGWIVFSALHCSAGDILMGLISLIIALLLSRTGKPSQWPKTKLILISTVVSVIYTVFSEQMNLANANWAYSLWMPMVPWLNIGLSPILQWLIVPIAAWRWAHKSPSP
jgi:hypothetical protein